MQSENNKAAILQHIIQTQWVAYAPTYYVQIFSINPKCFVQIPGTGKSEILMAIRTPQFCACKSMTCLRFNCAFCKNIPFSFISEFFWLSVVGDNPKYSSSRHVILSFEPEGIARNYPDLSTFPNNSQMADGTHENAGKQQIPWLFLPSLISHSNCVIIQCTNKLQFPRALGAFRVSENVWAIKSESLSLSWKYV